MANNINTKTIYEIFRSCRLCGSGGGYKMPIIQSVIEIDFDDIDLSQKIRECVNIEVREDDKMPPLICELCANKINEFHDFQQMCRNVNSSTRLRLGLPLSDTSPSNSSEDCILGVTEPVFINNTTIKDTPPPVVKKPKLLGPKSKREERERSVIETPPPPPPPPQPEVKKPKLMGPKSKREERERLEKQRLEEEAAAKKKEEERLLHFLSKRKKSEKKRLNREVLALQAEVTKLDLNSSRESRQAKSKPDPPLSPRPTRNSVQEPLSDTQNDFDSEDDELLVPRVKRSRDQNQIKLEIPSKKVKITMNIPQKPVSPAKSDTPKTTRDSSKDKTPLKTAKEQLKTTPIFQEPLKPSKEPLKSPKEPLKPSKETKPTKEPLKTSKESPKTPKETFKTPKEPPKTPKESPKTPKETFKIPKEPLKTPKESPKTPKESLKTPKEPLKTPKEPPKTKDPPKSSEVRFTCAICESPMKTVQALNNHLRVHTVNYTDPNLSCNACSVWFTSSEDMIAHRKKHNNKIPYKCRYCKVKYKALDTFSFHYEECQAAHLAPTPDVQCTQCNEHFITETLKNEHKCQVRKTHLCPHCDKPFANRPNVSRHLKICDKIKAKTTPAQVKIPPKLKRRLKPAQVRLVRCDLLLKSRSKKRHTFDVSKVKPNFGLDKKCVYPYMKICKASVKSEPLAFDGMVSINQEIRDEFYREEDYVHWDSDISDDSDFEEEISNKKVKNVPTLIHLSLKTIFSKRCLGKVPRKLRKVKPDKLFESLFTNIEDNNSYVNQISSNNNDDKVNDDKTNDNLYNNDVSVNINFDDQDSDSLLDKSILANDDFKFDNDDTNSDKVDSKVNDSENIINNDNENTINIDNVNDINNETSNNEVNDDTTDGDTQDTNTNINDTETDASMNGEEMNDEPECKEKEQEETFSNGIEKTNDDFENGFDEKDNDTVENVNDNDSRINNDKIDDYSAKNDNYNDCSDKLVAALNDRIGENVNECAVKDNFAENNFEF